jgi:hypothetical protein
MSPFLLFAPAAGAEALPCPVSETISWSRDDEFSSS